MSPQKITPVTQAPISPRVKEADPTLIPWKEQLLAMGPLGMARAGGQILFDLAFKEPYELVGTPDILGNELKSRLIPDGELSPWAINSLKVLRVHSMVGMDPLLSTAVLCRLATLDLVMGGRFKHGSQAN